MKCSKCGYEFRKPTNYCPACGTQLSDEDKAALSSQKHPAKKMKVFLWGVISALVLVALFILLSPDITDTVKNQLKAIREGHLEEAYTSYTSKAFQQTTSFDQFAEFMKSHPALLKSSSVRFIDRKQADDSGELDALVETSGGKEVPVQYKLVYEGDQWRILNIRMERFVSQGEAKSGNDALKRSGGTIGEKDTPFDSKPLEAVINGQMEAIRADDIQRAYDDFSSKDFKKTASYKEFEAFVKEQTGFHDNAAVEVGDLTFDNNIATLIVRLKNTGGKEITVEYDLALEDNAWKIVHLDVVDEPVADNSGQKTTTAGKLDFKQFVIGTAVDKEGQVIDPDAAIRSNSNEIFLNLYVTGALKGTKVELVLEHVDSGSKVDPILAEVAKDGESILFFSFTPPKEGWPEGTYRFLVNASTGEISSYDFKIK